MSEVGPTESGSRPAREGAAGAADVESATGCQLIECSIRIGGVDFVLMPAERRAREMSLNAVPSRGAKAIPKRLWEARREAGLTQAQLAKRLGRSQAMVSQAESGHSYVSERYVRKVVEACELPAGWGQPDGSGESALGSLIAADEIAGIDPVTCQLVQRGSERDRELARTYVWWDNFRSATDQDTQPLPDTQPPGEL